MLLVHSHIQGMMGDSTCAYAAGWSTTIIPWDNKQASPKPRWPGADGENAKRLEKATRELEVDNVWPFFLEGDTCGQDPRLVLSHGGNMIEATSFYMVDLRRRQAVVVLSNTRGYLVDVANFVGLLIASCGGPSFQDQCDWVKELANHVAASYLWDMHHYEESLCEDFPQLASPQTFGGCIGTYQLAEGIFATVSIGKAGGGRDSTTKIGQLDTNQVSGETCLVLRLYGSGYSYPLRVSQGAVDNGTQVKMIFATSMSELLPSSVGGTNRLTVEDFEIEFRHREQGQFQDFVWAFDRAGGKSADPNAFAFKRIPDTAEMSLEEWGRERMGRRVTSACRDCYQLRL